MNAGQRLTRRVASKLGRSAPDTCLSCPSRRTYASAVAAAAPTPTDQQSSAPSTPSKAPLPIPSEAYSIRAGVLLSRPPILTRDLTPFEKSFYLYQRRLNERLALPFTRYFYIPKFTPGDIEWKRKIKKRLTPARDIGRYAAYGKENWNDELIVGAQESETSWQVDRLIEDAMTKIKIKKKEGEDEVAEMAQAKKKDEVVVEKPPERVSEADRTGDEKRLDRRMQDTLYLVVRNEAGRWIFPEGEMTRREMLHFAAERVLVQSCGINMNTWVVGNTPIGHYQYSIPTDQLQPLAPERTRSLGEKTFFMKARIMAGQADLKENLFGLKDFKWLAKDEVKKYVSERYWSAVKGMFAER